jgi:hypothetical protein
MMLLISLSSIFWDSFNFLYIFLNTPGDSLTPRSLEYAHFLPSFISRSSNSFMSVSIPDLFTVFIFSCSVCMSFSPALHSIFMRNSSLVNSFIFSQIVFTPLATASKFISSEKSSICDLRKFSISQILRISLMSSGQKFSGTCICSMPSITLLVRPTIIPAGITSPGEANLSNESIIAVHLSVAPTNIHGFKINPNAAAVLKAS